MREIKLHYGYGPIKLGMEQAKVESIMGQPDEIENEDGILNWHYDMEEVSLSFDGEADWRLVTIATSNAEAEIGGIKLIGKDEQSVLIALEAIQMKSNDVEELEDEGDQIKILSFEKESINLWFINNVLSEIQMWPQLGAEDTVIWPED